LGNKVYLITSEKLRDKPWPHDYIDETFTWKVRISIEFRTSTKCCWKSNQVDAIVALDDYDVEKQPILERTRIDGMGQTTGRYFRDKLAMRMRAKSCGISIPAFVLYLTIMTSILSLITFLLHGF
jgi:hypothetical protein